MDEPKKDGYDREHSRGQDTPLQVAGSGVWGRGDHHREAGRPVARLVAAAQQPERRVGECAGRTGVGPEFDEVLPEEALEDFEQQVHCCSIPTLFCGGQPMIRGCRLVPGKS